MINIDPARPYLAAIKAIAYLVIASVLLFGGCSWGKSIEAADHAEAKAKLAKSLRAAQDSLSAAAGALNAQNAANKLRVEEARRAGVLAGKAEGIAAEQAEQGDRIAAAYSKGMRDAARKSPDCDALLKTDVLRMCGL